MPRSKNSQPPRSWQSSETLQPEWAGLDIIIAFLMRTHAGDREMTVDLIQKAAAGGDCQVRLRRFEPLDEPHAEGEIVLGCRDLLPPKEVFAGESEFLWQSEHGKGTVRTPFPSTWDVDRSWDP